MSQLLLIRHGQATPFEADTDRLSALGRDQARSVGESLVDLGVEPTAILAGPMVRQARTAELAAEAAQGAWPDVQTDPRLAEYDGDGLIRTLAPLLAAREPSFDALLRDFEERQEAPDRNRYFQRMLEALVDAYLRGSISHPQVETWAAFKTRVRAALADVFSGPSDQTVLAFTSGGVIGLSVAGVLEAPDASALKLNWRVKNGSITRFTYGRGGRVSLDSFNETAHLGPELVTWR